VIGVDGNGELLRVAESRQIPNAEFRWADLRALEDLDVEVDGIWCSFAAAYFPDLSSVLASWQRFIKKGGWIALTEVDDLFGHEPMTPETKAVFDAYARNALEAGHYDFHMGRKLRGQLEQAGFTVANAVTLEDQELSFDGPATPDVVDSWRSRFERMQPLRDTNFAHIRDEFLATLTRPDHRSRATVHCCIARFAKFAD
jgi:SAM-dependent methyltransferase